MSVIRVSQWLEEQGGNVSLVLALCAIPLLGAVLGATELYNAANERALLQSAVDAGALAGAGRLSVAGAGRSTAVNDTAISTAQQNLDAAGVTSKVDFTVTIDTLNDEVTLSAASQHKALINFGGIGDATIHVNATAENLNAIPLCILQTGEGGTGKYSNIAIHNTARIRANGCAVHSNESITVDSGAMIQADRTQAVGTVSGPISPAGNSGAMAIADPFAAMNLKAPTDCIGKAETLEIHTGGILNLAPGVHCQHFDIEQMATLHLMPGDHYFMADLEAHGNSIIEGDDVALIFGTNKKVTFADKATVRLSARKTGPFAGFLIVTTRDNKQQFIISSDSVSKLLGTIYIPNAQLLVQTSGSVAQDSAWSIIVADSLVLNNNPTLVINTGYVGSGVPVPQGVGPGNGKPKLTK